MLISYINGSISSLYYYSDAAELIKIASESELPPKIDNATPLGRSGVPTYGEMMKDIDRIELSSYGLAGYTLSKANNFFTVFSSSGAYIHSFSLPSDSLQGYFIAGGKMVYQTCTRVERAPYMSNGVLPWGDSEYTYADEGYKYFLVTYSKDLSTGETKEIEFPYLISSNSLPYKDKSGIYNYFLLILRPIDNKILSEDSIEMVADASLSFLKNVSGESVSSFIKLDEGHYYNTRNRIIYGSDFKPLLYIGSLNPTLYMEEKCFVGSIDGYYGAIDFSGKVVIEFNNVSILGIKGDKAIVKRNDGYYRLDTQSGEKAFLGEKCANLCKGLYIFEKESSFSVSSISKDVLSKKFVYDENGDLVYHIPHYNLKTNFLSGDYAFLIYDGVIERFANNKYEGSVKLSLNGDIDVSKRLALTSEDAVKLVDGENDILVSNEEGYFSFSTSANKLYCLDFPSSLALTPYTEVSEYSSSSNWDYYCKSGCLYYKASSSGSFLFSLKDDYSSYSLFKAKNKKVTLTSFDEGEHVLNPKKANADQTTSFICSNSKHKYFVFEAPSSLEEATAYRLTLESEFTPLFSGSSFRKVDYKTYEVTVYPSSSYPFEIYSSQTGNTSISFTISQYEA